MSFKNFNGPLNDKAIRLSHLKAAYTAVSENRGAGIDNGPVLASLQSEITALNQMIATDVAMFRRENNRWP